MVITAGERVTPERDPPRLPRPAYDEGVFKTPVSERFKELLMQARTASIHEELCGGRGRALCTETEAQALVSCLKAPTHEGRSVHPNPPVWTERSNGELSSRQDPHSANSDGLDVYDE